MTRLAVDAGRRSSHSKKTTRWSRLRGLALVAVLALLALLLVKLEFKSPHSNDVFYAYGILVTAVILITMSVAFGFYRDPALVVRSKRPDMDPAVRPDAAWPL